MNPDCMDCSPDLFIVKKLADDTILKRDTSTDCLGNYRFKGMYKLSGSTGCFEFLIFKCFVLRMNDGIIAKFVCVSERINQSMMNF